jgi:4-diphosphocytidyl-2-C-methyl-D-erythritol kinase
MPVTTIAPAKINWTLEVLGKRADGFHEVRTILQTIELHDEVSVESSDRVAVSYAGRSAPRDDSVRRAADSFAAGSGLGATISVTKQIPGSAGLGGGSSDAAATLRSLAAVWGINEKDRLPDYARALGSDVTFFLTGGTALAKGRGEVVTPLPDVSETWMLLVVPPISITGKTRRMYSSLRPSDFSDGSNTMQVAERIREGKPIGDDLMCNAFERAAFEAFEGLEKYREWMMAAGARRVHLAGAGPSLFALASGEAEARAMRARITRPKMGERVYAVRTISAAEATLVW